MPTYICSLSPQYFIRISASFPSRRRLWVVALSKPALYHVITSLFTYFTETLLRNLVFLLYLLHIVRLLTISCLPRTAYHRLCPSAVKLKMSYQYSNSTISESSHVRLGNDRSRNVNISIAHSGSEGDRTKIFQFLLLANPVGDQNCPGVLERVEWSRDMRVDYWTPRTQRRAFLLKPGLLASFAK